VQRTAAAGPPPSDGRDGDADANGDAAADGDDALRRETLKRLMNCPAGTVLALVLEFAFA
jgi:hypothetical protein